MKKYIRAIGALLTLIVSVDGQSAAGNTLNEKWDIGDPGISFQPSTNTFTLSFPVDDSIVQANLHTQMYESGCFEGNQELNAADGMLNLVNSIPTTGTASVSFSLDMPTLVDNPDVFSQVDPEEATLEFCARFMLQTTVGALEVNYLESLITVKVNLLAGFVIEAINLDPLERLVDTRTKSYDVEAFLCDVATGQAQPPNLSFNQGSVVGVCIKPNQAAIDDGLLLDKIDWFKWVRGVVEQDAIVGGSQSANGLTSFSCASGSTICSFESMLWADFYRPPTGAPTTSPVALSGSSPTSMPGGMGVMGVMGTPSGGMGSQTQWPTDASSYMESNYYCEYTTPLIGTNTLIFGLCEYGSYSFEVSTGSWTQTYNFGQDTVLFDSPDNFTPDPDYAGYRALCEGGRYHRTDYETVGVLNTRVTVQYYTDDIYQEDYKVCVMIADVAGKDGGASFHSALASASNPYSSVPSFTFSDSNSTDPNSTEIEMKVYCVPMSCSPFRNRNLQGFLDAEVAGEGQASLAFSRRKLEGDEEQTRLLQEPPSAFDIELTVDIITGNDRPGPVRTAGGIPRSTGLGVLRSVLWVVALAIVIV